MIMFFLKRNLSAWERALRIAMGSTIFATALAGHIAGVVTFLALASAGTLALTASIGFCLACALVEAVCAAKRAGKDAVRYA